MIPRKQLTVPWVPVRQTVLCGSVDGNGQPNALSAGTGLSVTLSASSSAAFTLAFAAGFDSKGAIDYVGQFTSNQSFASLTASTTLYLYVDRNSTTGALSLGFTTAGFTYGLKAPSAPTVGFHWFDLTAFQMKQWNGSVWVTVQRVIVGECVTSASAVTSTTTYAYRGYFSSNWFAVAVNTVYNINHNLGIQLASANPSLTLFTSVNGSDADAVPGVPSYNFMLAYYGYQWLNGGSGGVVPWKTLQLTTKDYVLLNASNTWVTSGYYSVKLSRGW